MSLRFYRPFPSPIRALSFDLDDTLYDNHQVIKDAVNAQYQAICRLVPAAQQKGQLYWFEVKHRVAAQYPDLQHDVTKWRQVVIRQGLTELGVSGLELDSVAEQVYQAFIVKRSDFQIPAQTFEVLKQLSKRYPLVAVTNGNVDIDTVGLAPYFVGYYRSGEQNTRSKPYPDMLHLASRHLDIPVNSILHIGDNASTDNQAAINAGAGCLWFNPKQKVLPAGCVLPNGEFSDLADLLQL